MKKILSSLFSLFLILPLMLCSCTPTPAEDETTECTEAATTDPFENMEFYKPVIYLYPEEDTEVSVKLDFKGALTVTIPDYRNGWNVLAKTDGTLTDLHDGKEYPYLFWEGRTKFMPDMTKGFVVKGDDTASFLEDILEKMGLLPHEIADFIEYWLPFMQKNPYNLITFQGENYKDVAPLTVTPAPDSILRVFMVYKPLEKPIEIAPPEIIPFERNGFSVIEWGGARLKGQTIQKTPSLPTALTLLPK